MQSVWKRVCRGYSTVPETGIRCIATPEEFGIWPLEPRHIRVKSYLYSKIGDTCHLADGGYHSSVCGAELDKRSPGAREQLCPVHWGVSRSNPAAGSAMVSDHVYQDSLTILSGGIVQRTLQEAEEARREHRKRRRSPPPAAGVRAPRRQPVALAAPPEVLDLALATLYPDGYRPNPNPNPNPNPSKKKK